MSTAPTETEEKRLSTTSVAAPSVSAVQEQFAKNAPRKHHRTLGLKLFDNLLYTVFTNFSVFGMSVGFTYMTKHGRTVGKEGSWLRGLGTWFAKRREPLLDFFGKFGIKGQAAEDATTVAFSFVDGTLFAPLVKLIEDRREKIAYTIDDTLGTKPDDLSAYEAEPKQSWRSVVQGRLATSAIVVPVAIAMEKTGGNNALFYRYGEKLANVVKESAPKLDHWLTKKTITEKKYFFQTVAFEAFYTSVCTLGLYLLSRNIARKHPPKHPNDSFVLTHQPANSVNGSGQSPRDETPDSERNRKVETSIEAEKPSTHAGQFTHLNRVANATPEHQLST